MRRCPSTDHPQRALECAIAIQALTPELNRELVEQGAPEVSFGIGLNTGDAVAAHFGGGRRRQYDVVGDTVNVGARLCSAAGRGEIILSDQLLTAGPVATAVEPVGPIELKGVSREVRLWRVVRPESATVTTTRGGGRRGSWRFRKGRSGPEERRVTRGNATNKRVRRIPMLVLASPWRSWRSPRPAAPPAPRRQPRPTSGTALANLKITARPGVDQAEGQVDVRRGQGRPGAAQGDTIKTDADGRAEIDYTDGSLTRLAGSTVFTISKLTNKQGGRQTQGTLSVGETWNRAAKVSETGSFEVKAGGTTAAVEGTAFVVKCMPEDDWATAGLLHRHRGGRQRQRQQRRVGRHFGDETP